jgi:hypothetical protein
MNNVCFLHCHYRYDNFVFFLTANGAANQGLAVSSLQWLPVPYPPSLRILLGTSQPTYYVKGQPVSLLKQGSSFFPPAMVEGADGEGEAKADGAEEDAGDAWEEKKREDGARSPRLDSTKENGVPIVVHVPKLSREQSKALVCAYLEQVCDVQLS